MLHALWLPENNNSPGICSNTIRLLAIRQLVCEECIEAWNEKIKILSRSAGRAMSVDAEIVENPRSMKGAKRTKVKRRRRLHTRFQDFLATKSFRTLAFAEPHIILPSVGILRESFYRLRVLYAGCAAPVSANQVERGSGIQERVAGWLDPIHSGNGVENDLSLGCVLFRNHAI
jgi:hypothetical protein